MKSFKQLSAAFLIAALIFAVGCQAGGGKFKDGVYNGSGEGKNGPLKVEVSVEKGKIKTISILEHSETPGLSDPILEKIPQEIIKKQSAEVEVISGATVTSEAIMNAVQDALKNAQ